MRINYIIKKSLQLKHCELEFNFLFHFFSTKRLSLITNIFTKFPFTFSGILQYFHNNSLSKIITGDLEKHFGITSGDIRTRVHVTIIKYKLLPVQGNISLLEGNLVISGSYLRFERGPFEIAEDVPYEIFTYYCRTQSAFRVSRLKTTYRFLSLGRKTGLSVVRPRENLSDSK